MVTVTSDQKRVKPGTGEGRPPARFSGECGRLAVRVGGFSARQNGSRHHHSELSPFLALSLPRITTFSGQPEAHLLAALPLVSRSMLGPTLRTVTDRMEVSSDRHISLDSLHPIILLSSISY